MTTNTWLAPSLLF